MKGTKTKNKVRCQAKGNKQMTKTCNKSIGMMPNKFKMIKTNNKKFNRNKLMENKKNNKSKVRKIKRINKLINQK